MGSDVSNFISKNFQKTAYEAKKRTGLTKCFVLEIAVSKSAKH